MERLVEVEVFGYFRDELYEGDTESPLRKVKLFAAKAQHPFEQLQFTWNKQLETTYERGSYEPTGYTSDGQSLSIQYTHPKRPA